MKLHYKYCCLHNAPLQSKWGHVTFDRVGTNLLRSYSFQFINKMHNLIHEFWWNCLTKLTLYKYSLSMSVKVDYIYYMRWRMRLFYFTSRLASKMGQLHIPLNEYISNFLVTLRHNICFKTLRHTELTKKKKKSAIKRETKMKSVNIYF